MLNLKEFVSDGKVTATTLVKDASGETYTYTETVQYTVRADHLANIRAEYRAKRDKAEAERAKVVSEANEQITAITNSL